MTHPTAPPGNRTQPQTRSVARSSTAGEARRFNDWSGNGTQPLAMRQTGPVLEVRATAEATAEARRRSGGFTLVEVLVAMVVFAIIGLASAAVVNTMMRTSEQSAEARENLSELQRAMFLLEQDLRQAVSRRTPQGDYYVRAGWFNPGNLLPRSELQPVRYQIDEDKNLVRQHYTYVDMSSSQEPTERIVLRGVTKFEVKPLIKGEESDDMSTRMAAETEETDAMAIPDGLEVTLETEQWGTIVRVLVLNGGDFSEPES
ncbi:type II secretion system minor pseudopilin GspJ [Pseudidiomarina sp. E22-M8]|uniref:type II secretion system minor pseudopilin GspJ n=1 Tax=Pseudidiomarina sp. E22-M8 TaxID=3424768 RepID=UPI00403C231D